MQLANRTAAALVSTFFLRPNLPVCSSNQTTTTTNMPRAAAIAVSHGGGPMPILGDPGHAPMVKSMKTRVPKILKLDTDEAPRAIVLVTAHWQESRPTISNGKSPKLYYDYGGFPAESYKLKYDAPGSPEVAREVFEVLKGAGFDPKMDSERGWDHGVFIPMLLINPSASIPVVQLSVLSSSSPSQHFAMGRALSSLRDSGVAIIGSGQPSSHNLRLLFNGGINDRGYKERNKEFRETFTKTMELEDVDERGRQLEGWRGWTGAFEAHPDGGDEHWLPSVVVAGAGGPGKAQHYEDEMMEGLHTSYYWT